MRKAIILILAAAIVLSSVAMVSAGAFDEDDAKLQSFKLPKNWEDREVYHENNSSRFRAFSSDKAYEYGVDFDTDVNVTKLVEVDNKIYQDGNSLIEIFEKNGTKYRVYVKYNGTDDISSMPEVLNEADRNIFKFNILNDIRL